MASEWIERMLASLAANERAVRKISARGGSVRASSDDREMGGDGRVYERQVVEGRRSTVAIPGAGRETKAGFRGQARIVQTSDGGMAVVAGGPGAPISVHDARRILNLGETVDVTRALRRDTAGRRRRRINSR